MKPLVVCTALLSLGLPLVTQAEFNYSNIEIAYADVEFDIGPFDVDGDGFSIGGDFEVSDSFFIGGEYSDFSLDFGIDGETLELGGGYFHPLNEDLDFVATFAYVEAEASVGNFSVDDDGLGIGGGVRARLGDSLEVEAMLNYVNMDEGDSDTGIALKGRYYFSDGIAVTGQADLGSDVETLRIGIRFEF